MTFSTTHSGLVVDLLNPNPATISLRDIATHLARTNRFNGATKYPAPYSVAQHSCVVVRLIQQKTNDAMLALQALLHDAHEYLTGDISTPFQEAVAPSTIKARQTVLDIAIHKALGVDYTVAGKHYTLLKWADATALSTEWRDMMPTPVPKHFLPPANFSIMPLRMWDQAEALFLKTFEKLAVAAGLTPHP
jgi:uncharacterized protein